MFYSKQSNTINIKIIYVVKNDIIELQRVATNGVSPVGSYLFFQEKFMLLEFKLYNVDNKDLYVNKSKEEKGVIKQEIFQFIKKTFVK